jgi:predicted nucleotide-binding protein (sugar kinase/HSP70/actin superfamily)
MCAEYISRPNSNANPSDSTSSLIKGKIDHYLRTPERPFTVEQRPNTTILFGNLTPKHEDLIKAVFLGEGYKFENLPLPTRGSFQTGREFCSNGLCNPNYFTAGSLIGYLEALEEKGFSRQEIIESHVYFTLADCGPCRFGMYQNEYRQALENAGFPGFRVITFQNNSFISEGASEPGLKFTADIGFGCLLALILGDLLYESTYNIRPYELIDGETDQAMEDCIEILSDFLHNRQRFEILQEAPQWISRRLDPQRRLTRTLNTFGKYRRHLFGEDLKKVLTSCLERLDRVEVDFTRIKPIVKVTGEFYSHLAESYANYEMFRFLEQEGAQVAVDTIAGHLLYWLHKGKLDQLRKKGLDIPYPNTRFWQLWKRLLNHWASSKKMLLLNLLSGAYNRHYARINRLLGGLAHEQVPQDDLVELSKEFFHPLTRGGEGYMEVAKSIYYTQNSLCHMVLSVKPFGCMPSTQSDGIMAAVTSRYEQILFVSVETSGDGDINALSRVQMALADARRRAQTEFDEALHMTGRQLDNIKKFAADHPELRRPSLHIPHRNRVAGVAANYVLYVSNLMNGGH